jgi:hypothetical protein
VYKRQIQNQEQSAVRKKQTRKIWKICISLSVPSAFNE